VCTENSIRVDHVSDAVETAVEMVRKRELFVGPARSPTLTANNQLLKTLYRDCAAAEARHRAAIPATTSTETVVPGGLDCERQLLRTGEGLDASFFRRPRMRPQNSFYNLRNNSGS
jgi:hypothetical protein